MEPAMDIISQPSLRNSTGLWFRLVEPSIAVRNSENRRQARFISGLILVLIVFQSIGLISTAIQRATEGAGDGYVFAMACLLQLISYVLSRTRYYYIAGILALLTSSLLPFGEAFLYRRYENFAVTLMWLILPLIPATFLFRFYDLILLVVIDIIGLVVLSVIGPQSVHYVLLLIGSMVFTTSGILFTLEIYRRRIEKERQSELVKSNQELETIRSSLEDQVAERTRSAEEAKAKVEEVNRALEMQMWQVSGLAELATVMRGLQNIEDLASSIIRQVCRYTEIPVGALFIAESDELYLAGSYAYPFVKNPNPRFRFGSGLVGEAALDQQVITLRDIPEHYLPITSGLGEVPPAQIVAVPCLYENHVVGVMELASMEPFTTAQTQFLTSAMESIASALNTAQIRGAIDELLIETQQQAEELRAQEEEQLRGSIELDQREAALRHKEQQLQEQRSKLEAIATEMKGYNAASQGKVEASDDD